MQQKQSAALGLLDLQGYSTRRAESKESDEEDTVQQPPSNDAARRQPRRGQPPTPATEDSPPKNRGKPTSATKEVTPTRRSKRVRSTQAEGDDPEGSGALSLPSVADTGQSNEESRHTRASSLRSSTGSRRRLSTGTGSRKSPRIAANNESVGSSENRPQVRSNATRTRESEEAGSL